MKKILIIDDDWPLLEATAMLLESQNYKVLTACDGKEGFQIARKEKPDLILLDVMISRKTEGFDIARNISKDKDTKNIPVILITAIRKVTDLPFDFGEDENWLPVKTILDKPVEPEILLKAIKENI